MACDTCGHTMHALGCRVTDGTLWVCPRCGTLKTCDGVVAVPDLVERCRKFAGTLTGVCAEHLYQWRATGVADSINLPGDRP